MIDRSHRRKFGQNYLVDPIIILRIQELLNPQPSDNFFEIGPGQGALTEFLVNQASHLTAIEIDTNNIKTCLLYTSPSPRDGNVSRMPSSA